MQQGRSETNVAFLARRQGKSQQILHAIAYCIAHNQTLLYCCFNPEKQLPRLQAMFPKVKMRAVKSGVEINVK